MAISTSKDSTSIVWDYRTGQVLRTFLLPLIPLCVVLDPADRAAYVGYEDGSVQMIDFYSSRSIWHPLHDSSSQPAPSQLPAEDRWKPPSADLGAVDSLSISYDGTTLISGHRNGKILSWNIARGKYASTVADYTHPITNLVMLPPAGLPHRSLDRKRVAHTIVKPRSDFALSDPSNPADAVPAEYAFSTQIADQVKSLSVANNDSGRPAFASGPFSQALTHASFPASMIEEGLLELASVRQPYTSGNQIIPHQVERSLLQKPETAGANATQIESLEAEVNSLKKTVTINETTRQTSTEEAVGLRSLVSKLQDHILELYVKEEDARADRIRRQARREERETKKREAWFEAERSGQRGDTVLKEMEAEESAVSNDTDDHSSDEN